MRILVFALCLWSGQAAQVCQRPVFSGGVLIPELKVYQDGAKVSYSCANDLKPTLNSWWDKTTCRNGTWSHHPQCIDKSACLAPHMPNGKPVDPLQTFYRNGRILAFQCDPGYELEGSEYGECVDGQWKLPGCKPKANSCGPPARVSNAVIKQPYRNVYAEGDRVEYVCQPGYQLEGRKYSSCSGGKWDSTPKCTKTEQIDPTPADPTLTPKPTERPMPPDTLSCPAPHVPHARQLDPVETAYPNGSLIAFQCYPGYKFEGDQYAVCLDGWWKLPVCKPKANSCGPPARVSNAVIKEPYRNVYAEGDRVEYVCQPGYQLEGRKYSSCFGGKWYSTPKCDTLPCPAPHVPHARQLDPVETSYPNGSLIAFQCYSGYKFEGDEYAVCLDGWWKLPVCKPQKDSVPDPDDQIPTEKPVRPDPPSPCRAPPSVPNAWLRDDSGSVHPHGSIVRYQCLPGYTFEGSTYAVCSNAQWFLPVCKRSPSLCHTPPPVPNAQALEDKWSPVHPEGSTITYRCLPGYTLEGPSYAVCTNGQWILPVCKRLRCSTLPYIDKAQITEVHFGMELWVSCPVDHVLEGSATVRCVNGRWGRLPVCKALCRIQRLDPFGNVWYQTLRDGEELSQWCLFPLEYHHAVCYDGVGWYRPCGYTDYLRF